MKLLDYFKRTNEEKKADDRPDFAGKILVVYCKSEERGGGFLQDARLIRVGFWEFLVGRRINLESSSVEEARHRAVVWIEFGDIAQMLVFDSIEDAKEAF